MQIYLRMERPYWPGSFLGVPVAEDELSCIERGTGQPLLLIHGLLMNGRMFDALAEQLEAYERRLIIPDLRGHGQSQHLAPPYSVAQHADDMITLMDRLGIETTDVLGYSQGGPIAQQIARRYPERVRRLFLVCTYAHNMLTLRERFEGRVLLWFVRLLPMEWIASLIVAQAKETGADTRRVLHDMITANRKDQALAAIREMQCFDSRAWLSEISSPTHVIAGDRDSAVPMHHAEMLQQRIPESSLRVFSGAGHTLIWTHAAQLCQEIVSVSR